MLGRRSCKATRADGQPCRTAPLTDSEFCAMHDPQQAEAMAEARRLGGIRRKREVTVSGAYEFAGIDSVEDIKRLVVVAILDTLALESSIARSRTIGYLAQVGAKLLETGNLQERVRILEAAVLANQDRPDSLSDQADDFALGQD
jgi:hypothetical protein